MSLFVGNTTAYKLDGITAITELTVISSSEWRVHNLFRRREDVQLGRGLNAIHDGPREICKEQML